MFLVTGITGKVGGATADALVAAGRPVRALVRDAARAAAWEQRGVELVAGDMDRPDDVARALDGVEAAFLMLPPTMAPSPDYREAKAVISSYVAALRRTPVPRLVVLSSFGSHKPDRLGNITTTHLFEAAIAPLDVPIAAVRAGGFIENFVPLLPRAAETGVLDTFYAPTDRPLPMVATRDIGREVARLLIEGFSAGTIVELGDRISPDAVAAGMAQALGRSVIARAVPRDRWTATLEAMGLPTGRTASFEEMMDGINAGWIDFGAPDAERRPGTTTPAEVFVAPLS